MKRKSLLISCLLLLGGSIFAYNIFYIPSQTKKVNNKQIQNSQTITTYENLACFRNINKEIGKTNNKPKGKKYIKSILKNDNEEIIGTTFNFGKEKEFGKERISYFTGGSIDILGETLTITGNIFSYSHSFSFSRIPNKKHKIGLDNIKINEKTKTTSLSFSCSGKSYCIIVNIFKDSLPTNHKVTEKAQLEHNSGFFFYTIPKQKKYCIYENIFNERNTKILKKNHTTNLVLDSFIYNGKFVGKIGGACIFNNNKQYEILVGGDYLGNNITPFTIQEVKKIITSFKIL